MNVDFMVYGRGLSQSEGFALQAAPAFVRSEMLLYLSDFQALGDVRNMIPPEILAKSPNPWADTYLFLCQPPPRCCVLLRITRAEGEAAGTWLKEVRGKDVWSLEGWCAPFEQRELFFALIPSLLLWSMEESRTLYNRSRNGEISLPAQIPDAFLFDPYADEMLSADLRSDLAAKKALDAWKSLCTCIRNASQPFPFLFGPLAQEFAGTIGSTYGIGKVFQTLGMSPLPDAGEDPFEKIGLTNLQDVCTEQHLYTLRLHTEEAGRRELCRSWGIYEPANAPDDILTSSLADVPEDGILMSDLLAEAEQIRNFASQMQWSVTSGDAPPKRRYQFVKEGS
ncbi:MAG: hypothetical protein II916_03615 [Oscillospiraceae bacterium]|nr:hypothetical protein [Oscillospiraceae bacterium]